MPNETGTTGHDPSRPVVPSRDNSEYTLTIEEVAERYAKAGHPRTIRSLQRYAVNGHLDARKVATTTGDIYLVTLQSVARHIAQIEELRPLDTVATDRDQPRPVATSHDEPRAEPTPVVHQVIEQNPQPNNPTPNDTTRQATTTTPDMSRYVARLEREVEMAQDDRDFLREQIDRKDKTIDLLLERDRETNFLMRGLQNLIPRLAPARPETPPPDQQHDQHP
jgi:hypothetical protein